MSVGPGRARGRTRRNGEDVIPPIVIMVAGVAGSGKTTLGRALASRSQMPILDLDSLTNPLLDAIAPRAGPH